MYKPELHFVTSNKGKFESAKIIFGDMFELIQTDLYITEDKDSVEAVAKDKANFAFNVLKRPVICDDSGFVIPSLRGYPGNKVAREWKSKGIEHFLNLAKDKSLYSYFIMAKSYLDDSLDEPKIFVSKVEGTLISEIRGDITKPFCKSPLSGCFIIYGGNKTIAEMSEEEYAKRESTNQWLEMKEFIKSRLL